jgi:hypothetical protein
MKWVKISIGSILALIVLATAAVAIAGMGADANRLYCSMVIRQKPAAIWPWLFEAGKLKQWVTWLVDVRDDGTSEPAPGRKSTWVMEDRNNGNQRMEIHSVVESVEPSRKLAVALDSPIGFRGSSVYRLTEQAGGATLLESDSRYTLENGFARFMVPLVIWQAKKKMLSDMDHLRALVEARP